MGNHNSGRRPKPLELHVLNGNPSKINMKTRRECIAKSPEGEVTKTPGLTEAASRIWDEIAPVLLQMGTLTKADEQAFAELCELQAVARYASKQKDDPNFRMFILTTMVDSAGNEHTNIKVHPAIKLELETAVKLRPYYDYFGMNPSSRSRLIVPKKEETAANPWAGALP